ncbi:CLUMA_CG005548, isoform A [Clunio marinus]|uniref:CLUMA_CG005548, isoform A n=1 Tax=Clunio marinus TaxID=568069 RepID=A0A1J1HWL6_9DIPT|nr:CLUMA_CG005548, isoform A [Clunio marinus]
MQQQRVSNYLDGNGRNPQAKQQQKAILNAINQLNQGEIIPEKYDEKVVKNRIIREKVKLMSESLDVQKKVDKNQDTFTMDEDLIIHNKTVSNIQIFYYLPVKWFKAENQSIFQLDTVFYPKRGLYNYSTIEAAKKILKEHFEEIRLCGIGVIILHWEPNNSELNDLLPIVFHLLSDMNKNSRQNQLKLAIQIGDYEDRTIESIRNNLKFFVDNYTTNPNFFKVYSIRRQKTLPIFYLKNAEKIREWSKLLGKNGLLTIRETNYDSFILAHLESKESKTIVRQSNFDGFYTYNTSNGANYFSTWKNWEKLKKFADMYHLMFVPTVGPGYHDASSKYNPLRRFRSNGQYFEIAFKTALLHNTEFVTIESYNNFNFGTQIEAVLPHSKFRDYAPHPPIKYLRIAQHWANQFYKIKLDNQRLDDKILCENLLNNTIC